MGKKCRYGRDSIVFYLDFEANELPYVCPRDAEVDGFCIFHKEGYWKESKEHEERVKKEFIEDFESEKKSGNKLLFIGYYLPDMQLEGIVQGALYFNQTTFRSVDFRELKPQKTISFRKAKFEQKANFSGMAFPQKVDFSYAIFQGSAIFVDAKFQQRVYFHYAIFHHWAEFFRAEVQQNADFIDTRFLDRATFTYMKFKKRADFNRAIFQGSANFISVMFESDTSFNDVRFEKITYFNYTKFRGNASFKETIFIIEDNEIPHDKETDYVYFRRAEFDYPEKIFFENCNLICVSFIHTDITRVKFRNITWPRPTDWKSDNILRRLFSRFGKTDAYMLLDEELLEREKKDFEPDKYDRDLTIENVLTVYRMLRENYEYNVDYETSGMFFVGEMEARRRNSNSSADRVILELYKLFALYGQSYLRPLCLLLILVIFFAFCRGVLGELMLLFQGMTSLDTVLIGEAMISMRDILFESVAVSLQLKGTEWIDVIQRGFSFLLFVLFGIALRRRFERRFRH